ncbi:MAG: hypothetical protein ACTSXH_18080 [Promethearchaeota archaeon]
MFKELKWESFLYKLHFYFKNFDFLTNSIIVYLITNKPYIPKFKMENIYYIKLKSIARHPSTNPCFPVSIPFSNFHEDFYSWRSYD